MIREKLSYKVIGQRSAHLLLRQSAAAGSESRGEPRQQPDDLCHPGGVTSSVLHYSRTMPLRDHQECIRGKGSHVPWRLEPQWA